MTKKERQDLYDMLFKRQYGKCAICGCKPEGRKFAIDHDHKTDKIRGLLCFRCNVAVGFFRDDPDLMLCASQYIDEEQWEIQDTKKLNKAWIEREENLLKQ